MSSKSEFDGAVYQGDTTIVSNNASSIEEFRVFHQGATSFVSVQTIRESAEKRATEFCHRTGRMPQLFRETTSRPPHILGNFPRIELVFGCVDKPLATPSGDDPKYARLINLKKLLDSGVLTREEFEREKVKILSLP
jgi:putative oligomerization/nucleic acid binding protein